MKASHGLSIAATTEGDIENGWQTPLDLVERIRAFYGGAIDLDPCTTSENPTQAVKFYTPSDDGILMPWNGRVYCNPPYGRTIAHWADKAIFHASTGGSVIMLVPARTDAAWFQRLAFACSGIIFKAGRLRFVGASSSAPFPNAIIGLNVNLEPLSDLGWFVPNRKVA